MKCCSLGIGGVIKALNRKYTHGNRMGVGLRFDGVNNLARHGYMYGKNL
ncbi:hypothetical protein [Limnospira platensis]